MLSAQFGGRVDIGAVQFCKKWEDLIEALVQKHGPSAKICVVPCGAIQHASGRV